MRIRTTSTQRTYRYVRLAIVGATVFLAVGVGIELVGRGVLPSVSAAYYTPAGPVFVGALSAIALALLALSGRSVEQGLLDVAAVLALVIAFVPTSVSCGVDVRCIPPEVRATVANNAGAVASVVLLGVGVAIVLARVQGTLSRGVVTTAAVITAIVLGGGVWARVAPEAFLARAHEAAAVAFFVLIAVVAGLAAWRPRPARVRRSRLRVAYATVAGAIGATLVLLIVAVLAGVEQRGIPVVLVGESVALALFAVFWIVQTVELWDEVDPSIAATRE
ncbi:hypothetical protein AB0O16_09820 [Microbacterium sp. NPDC089180]|uniref:hypothetical protein n=1 Tax=unclassified Microbacterium TaxID=2609290 RepID=UPI003421EDDA